MLYFDSFCLQAYKKGESVCGDVYDVVRTAYHTTALLIDGVGSGLKANIAAEMTRSRIKALLSSDISPRKIFDLVIADMNEWRDQAYPFCAITVVRAAADGAVSILVYENPQPLFVCEARVYLPQARPILLKKGIAAEYTVEMTHGDALIFSSDGITQSGLGALPKGFGIDGMQKSLSRTLRTRPMVPDAAQDLFDVTTALDAREKGDDKTLSVLSARNARVVDIFTGPPSSADFDEKAVRDFAASDSVKIICGGTTAGIFARILKKELSVEKYESGIFAPPKYAMSGFDLVTEGVLTLNQACNIIRDDLYDCDETPATQLARYLRDADVVRVTLGQTVNPANNDATFKRLGLRGRWDTSHELVTLLSHMGKIVSVTTL